MQTPYDCVKKTLNERYKAVYDIVSRNPGMCVKEASKLMNCASNDISGRFTELKNMNVFIPRLEVCKITGFKTTHYKINKLFEIKFMKCMKTLSQGEKRPHFSAGESLPLTPDSYKKQRNFFDWMDYQEGVA